jgi:hypothetical protein
MANLITDIVKTHIVDRLDNELKIIRAGSWNSITQLQTVTFCDIKWLQLYGRFLEGQEVISITGNQVVLTSPSALAQGEYLHIERPKFFHGTPYNTVQEWHDFTTQERDKLPFIWLVTPSNESYNNYKSTVERVSSCQLFFVHWSDWQMLNQTRINETIAPLQRLVDSFVDAVDNNVSAFDFLGDRGQRKEYPKFGRESSKGIEEVIMNSTLGAVKLDISLRIKRDLICKCDTSILPLNIFDETFDNTFE